MTTDFIIENNKLIKYNGKNKIIKIPDNIEIIGLNSFLNNKYIEEIIIPQSVYDIEESAFKNCKNLKKVVLPKSIKKINRYVFENCVKLEKINLSNIKTFEMKSFANTNLKKLSLSNKELINEYAFAYCQNLEYIKLNNIKDIRLDVFSGNKTKKLVIGEIESPASMINFSKIEEIEFLKKYEEEFINTIIGCGNSELKKVTGPNVITENDVVYNSDKTVLISFLERKQDTYFKVPDSVKIIESFAIYNENLKTLELGKNVEELKESSICCENILLNNNLKKLNYSCIGGCIKDLDFRKTKIEEFYSSTIITEEKINVKLPKEIKYINIGYQPDSYNIILNKECQAKIVGPTKHHEYIKYEKTLEELIEEGKSFHEANLIIKEQYIK